MDQDRALVAEYMTSLVPTAHASESVGDVLDRLSGHRFDSVDTVYVLDDTKKLAGAARLTDIYAAPHGAQIGTLMLGHPPSGHSRKP